MLELLGVVFFVLTDPRFGTDAVRDGDPNTNIIDAMHALWPVTVVRLVGSGMVLLIAM